MEKKALSVCLLVGTLGTISVLLGIVAELHRVKKSEITAYEWDCVYPSSPSPGLAYGATVALFLARIILSIAGGWCSCCRSNSNNSVTIGCGARLCSILSWLAAVMAPFMFIGGATIGNKRHGEMSDDGTFTCYYVKPGVFAGGALMALLSIVLGIISYLILSSARQNQSSETLHDDIEKPQPPPTVAAMEMNSVPAAKLRY